MGVFVSISKVDEDVFPEFFTCSPPIQKDTEEESDVHNAMTTLKYLSCSFFLNLYLCSDWLINATLNG